MITCLEINTRAVGNALFEYSTLFGVGNKLNLPIRIPSGQNHTHQPTGQKIWQLKEIFNIQTPDITQLEIESIKQTYVEKHKGFNKEIFDVLDDTNLIGFFQHEDYFNFCGKELREQLIFKDSWIQNITEKFKELGVNPNNCISIHVRRGDYTKPHLQPFHPLLPFEYYSAAINNLYTKLIDQGIDALKLYRLIFSDDPEYCRNTFKGHHVITIDNSGEDGNIIDLCMMSMCKYHILANSSFSWWAAWLSGKENVLYPSVWFGHGYGYYNIVSNPNWIKI
jgi:hypothetical protein